MKTCQNKSCSAQIADQAIFCPQCGTPSPQFVAEVVKDQIVSGGSVPNSSSAVPPPPAGRLNMPPPPPSLRVAPPVMPNSVNSESKPIAPEIVGLPIKPQAAMQVGQSSSNVEPKRENVMPDVDGVASTKEIGKKSNFVTMCAIATAVVAALVYTTMQSTNTTPNNSVPAAVTGSPKTTTPKPVIQPLPTSTIVNSPTNLAKLIGKKSVSLQWISWDYFGSVNITNTNGLVSITGGQRAKEGSDYLKIDGVFSKIDEREITFQGQITTQISHIYGGRACVRSGIFHFQVPAGKKYWRLVEMGNTCDPVTDYIDIYF